MEKHTILQWEECTVLIESCWRKLGNGLGIGEGEREGGGGRKGARGRKGGRGREGGRERGRVLT